MFKAATSNDPQDELASSLPDAGALSAAFIALKQQIQVQNELIDKKSEVIQFPQARIAVLDEQLHSNKIERFAASRETNPLQARLFNEVEQLGEGNVEAEDEADGDDSAANKAHKTAHQKRKALNPAIPRNRQCLLLTDEQRKDAIDTFFVPLKKELDITPAQVQVIEILQEKSVYLDQNGDRKLVAAQREPHPLGKSIASVSLLAYLIIAKYSDGMPLYRLESILKGYGGRLAALRWAVG